MAESKTTSPADRHQVDLTNCDREPIHQLGRIQSFAWLLAFTRDWSVCRVSANIASLLGHEPDAVLGAQITELFLAEAVHAIRGQCALLTGGDSVERLFGIALQAGSDDRFDIALHVSGRVTVVEIEKQRSDTLQGSSGMMRSIMARLDNAQNLDGFLHSGARIIRAITEFDRVMIYRFDRDGHGTVAAEALAAGTESFLGLNYPASDVPKQARALYLRTPFRIIADVAAETVAILPEHNEFGEPLDLSLSIARAVSPIHIEYLGNMGIAASLSISIIVDGALWGLIACHHRSARLPSFNARSLAELFGQMFSMRLEARLHKEIIGREREARMIGDRLLAGIADNAGLLANPEHISQALQNIIASDGVATLTEGNYASIGHALPLEAVQHLAKLLNAMEGGAIIVEECISQLLPSAAAFAHIAAGFLVIPISRKPRDYVFLFRREQVRTVSWAGNPEKPLTVGENGTRLTPRGSFDAWVEHVSGKSVPFTEAEIAVGEALRLVLNEVVLRISEAAQENSRQLTERQELLIAELNHRVRNILALIRGIVRQSQPGNANMADYIAMLTGRVESLARAHDHITRERWAAAPIRPLFEEEASVYLHDRIERLVMQGPDVLLEPECYATLALVVHELVTNSAKYGALSDSGLVTVTWSVDDQERLAIEWRETGGPPVKPPLRRGFGSTIIERTVPHDLGGEARVDYHVVGLTARFVIPSRYFRLDSTAALPFAAKVDLQLATGEREESASGLPGHVLLVEDSLIIALDAEEALQSAGVATVTVVSTVNQALLVLESQEIDAALLDINLGNQLSLPVAEELLKRAIPFAFATGYGDQIDFGDQFAAVPVLQKPYRRDQILEILIGFKLQAAD